ncbi:LysE family transporter [Methanopyrus sp. SNP6]|uniref:LysE family transporter n=1 Tax=Methanopyrus sp. SNP6 TaxID=1937005 RepID=UPI00143A1D04|nr:LysE family translocator [Methanopyrus sp. SNP6]
MNSIDLVAVGVASGVGGGLAPGPLQALIVAETLKNGLKAGLSAAVVPVITDIPLIVIASMIATRLPDLVLKLLGMVGSAVLAYMGLSMIVGAGSVESVESENTVHTHTLRRAVVVNLLNPHPYVFWFTVGSSVMGSARSTWSSMMFPLGFFLGIVSVQTIISLAVHWTSSISPMERSVARRLSGILLIGAAAYLAYTSVK